jgi:hypothetical protein
LANLKSPLEITSNYTATANLHNSQITTASAKLFQAYCLFTGRSLATVSNSVNSSASRAQVHLSQPPLQSSTLTCQFSTDWIASNIFFITPRHGQHIKHPVLTINLFLRAYSFPRERVYVAVAQTRSLYIRLLHSNGCTRCSVVPRPSGL